jgi:hypothetical protein
MLHDALYGTQGWQYKEIYYLGFVELRMKQPFLKFRIVLFRFSEIWSQVSLQGQKGRSILTAKLDKSGPPSHVIDMWINLSLWAS